MIDTSIIIMRRDPEMSTHDFITALKVRQSELASELDAINKVLTFHGDASPIPPPPVKAKKERPG